MSKWPMRGHFRYLRFKTFSMTPRTPQCKVFWALLSSSKHSGVSEDSKFPTLGVLGFTPTLGQSGVATCHIDFRSLESSMPIFLAKWIWRITGWAPISRSITLDVCPPTWIIDLVLSTVATLMAMEVFSLGITFGNQWKTLWKGWLSTTPLLSNKSTSEVF